MVRICVAGSVVRDRVRTFSGGEFESFGGILYNVYGFFMESEEICVVPVFYASSGDLRKIKGGLRGFRSIDWTFVKDCRATDENFIVYTSSQEREENYVKNCPPLTCEDIKDPMDSCQAVLINFIREDDFPDLSCGDLSSFDGIVYVDLHKKAFHLDSDFVSCVKCSVDILQCNEREYDALVRFTTLEELFSGRLSYLVVTMGRRGASFCGRELVFRFFPAPDVDEKDPTGAGDIFGSVFLRRYVETKDPVDSLCEAVRLSSLSVSREGLGVIP